MKGLLIALLLAFTLPAQAPIVTHYGTGCGTAEMTLSPPRIGQPLYALVPDTVMLPGAVIVGFFPATIPMGDGCTLLVMPREVVSMWSETRLLFTIPNNAGFIGFPLYAQYRSDWGAWSNGVKGVVGQ